MSTTAVIQQNTQERSIVQNITSPMAMLATAVERGADISTIERLAELAERMEQQRARRDFDEAISAAKAEIPVIHKNKTVDFTSQKGRTNYSYEDLAEISRCVSPVLAKYGLSYRFRTSVENSTVVVTCIISHRGGHFEENSLPGSRDESGNKNNNQALGSTVTYLQRYTLKAALGLAASVDDDSLASSGRPEGLITSEEAEAIDDMLSATKADRAGFLKYFKLEDLSDLPARRYNEAVSLLQRKARAHA